jgi:hypothetical protein
MNASNQCHEKEFLTAAPMTVANSRELCINATNGTLNESRTGQRLPQLLVLSWKSCQLFDSQVLNTFKTLQRHQTRRANKNLDKATKIDVEKRASGARTEA